MKRVLVLSESDDCADLAALPLREFDVVVLAFWASPEFVARVEQHGAKVCWRLNDFVPAYLSLLERAYRLGHQVAASAPRYREVNPLQAWENVIANALLVPLVMTELEKGLRERLGSETEIVFLTRNDTQRGYETIHRNGTTVVLWDTQTFKQHDAGGRLITWLKLVAEARRDGDWENVVAVPVETLDAQYMWRSRFRTHNTSAHNDDLFYSSYVNYARVLAKHAAARNLTPQWVVNSHSAHKGLPRGAQVSNLWEYGTPRVSAHQEILQATNNAFANAPEDADGFPLRAALAASGEVHETLTRVLPRLLAEIDLMHACLDELQPKRVWTANQWGGEGCMLQVAQAHQIPVTQVQHGFLEPYYMCAPIYTERFLVWDKFWLGVVAQAARPQVEIFDPNPAPSHTEDAAPAPKTLTYFSAPPHLILWWNPSALVWETVTLLDELMATGYNVTLRAHPMDRLDLYTSAWIEKDAMLPSALTLNKGTPLEPLLERTARAVMYFSTVLMDCRAYDIPVYGTGWYPLLYRAQVERTGAIAYHDSIHALVESLV